MFFEIGGDELRIQKSTDTNGEVIYDFELTVLREDAKFGGSSRLELFKTYDNLEEYLNFVVGEGKVSVYFIDYKYKCEIRIPLMFSNRAETVECRFIPVASAQPAPSAEHREVKVQASDVIQDELKKLQTEIANLRMEVNATKPVKYNTIDISLIYDDACVRIRTEEDEEFEARIFKSLNFTCDETNTYTYECGGRRYNMKRSKPHEDTEQIKTFKMLLNTVNIRGTLNLLKSDRRDYVIDYNKELLELYNRLDGLYPINGFGNDSEEPFLIAQIRYTLDENAVLPKDKDRFINGEDRRIPRIMERLFG